MIMGLLGLGKAKTIAMVAVGVAVAVVIGMLYLQNRALTKDNATLRTNNGKLTTTVETQQQTIDEAVAAIGEWDEALRQMQATMSELARVQQAASAETRRLNDVFAKHDLGRLSLARPGLIEPRLNAGTADVLRMFERATAEGGDGTGAGDPEAGRQ